MLVSKGYLSSYSPGSVNLKILHVRSKGQPPGTTTSPPDERIVGSSPLLLQPVQLAGWAHPVLKSEAHASVCCGEDSKAAWRETKQEGFQDEDV
eukprot:866144-Rhodomonas_salina.6